MPIFTRIAKRQKAVAVERRSASQTCAIGAGWRAAVNELEGETHVSVRRVCCYGSYSAPLSAIRQCSLGDLVDLGSQAGGGKA